MSSIIVWNLSMVLVVKQKFGFIPFTFHLLKDERKLPNFLIMGLKVEPHLYIII